MEKVSPVIHLLSVELADKSQMHQASHPAPTRLSFTPLIPFTIEVLPGTETGAWWGSYKEHRLSFSLEFPSKIPA